MIIVYLILAIPVVLLFIFVGLIIRYFFSQYKKIILFTLFLMVLGSILFCIGVLPIIAAGASASGAGNPSVSYDPGLYFLLSALCFISVIPLSVISFFKK